MTFTPCDAHFADWWRYWCRVSNGVGTVQDMVLARMCWETSMAIQIKLGAID